MTFPLNADYLTDHEYCQFQNDCNYQVTASAVSGKTTKVVSTVYHIKGRLDFLFQLNLIFSISDNFPNPSVYKYNHEKGRNFAKKLSKTEKKSFSMTFVQHQLKSALILRMREWALLVQKHRKTAEAFDSPEASGSKAALFPMGNN